MAHIHPILFVDLLKQSSYKNTILLSMMHKQKTYFLKKYSKANRITLNNATPKNTCDNIKQMKYIYKKKPITSNKFLEKNITNCKIIRYIINVNLIHNIGNLPFGSYDYLLKCASKCGNLRTIKLVLNAYIILKTYLESCNFSVDIKQFLEFS